MATRKKTRILRDRQRAVIFDFDGTLADSLPAVIQVFEEMTGRIGHYSLEQVQAYRDLSVPELMRELKVPRWKAPLLLIRGRKMLRNHLHGISVHEGIPELLQTLCDEGVPLYVLSSNSTENLHSYLAWHKLSHFFKGVYGGASLVGKAPRLLKMVEDECIDIERSWYVGDEMRDVSAARAVGFQAASVTWGYNTRAALESKHPDIVVDTTKQLLKELRKAWKK